MITVMVEIIILFLIAVNLAIFNYLGCQCSSSMALHLTSTNMTAKLVQNHRRRKFLGYSARFCDE